MPRLPLTDEQKAAVCSASKRLFIEAAPGSGKTTVASERFGVLRFRPVTTVDGSMAAVSFTRSATGELRRRIRSRWGSTSLAWPHGVTTIDTLVCNVVHHLLRQHVIHWPGDHETLEVLDDWRGHRGYRWLEAGSHRRVVTVSRLAMITSLGRRLREPQMGFGSVKDFHDHLGGGRCTHEEVRHVVTSALRQPALREAITRFLSDSVGHIIVDEVFDANELDLNLVLLACDAGISVTLIGDPWQALYGFRGATPELVPRLVEGWGFESAPLSQSFRFKTPSTQDLSLRLRAGNPVSIRPGDSYDVVLASRWDGLWDGPDRVLPLSFGRSSNKMSAAMILLLDHVVQARFNRRAIFLAEALALLNLDDATYRSLGPEALGEVERLLVGSGADGPEKALQALRPVMRLLGAPRQPRASTGDSEARQIGLMRLLAARLRSLDPLVPGMTIHQAKGCEWDRVGVRLTPAECARLASGLSRDYEGDRGLYVALTRACQEVSLVS